MKQEDINKKYVEKEGKMKGGRQKAQKWVKWDRQRQRGMTDKMVKGPQSQWKQPEEIKKKQYQKLSKKISKHLCFEMVFT